MKKIKGDVESFDKNWRFAEESNYIHWTRGLPKNQIQLAFRNHWFTFQEIIGDKKNNKKVLEVGCGRGSLSAYFSDAGYDVTLLDMSSRAIELARKAFYKNKLEANFVVNDCLNMKFEKNTFDIIFSIGLLEHFENIDEVIKEQVRVLKKGGKFIGYVVPEIKNNIQDDFKWINEILKTYAEKKASTNKESIFRSDVMSTNYLKSMKNNGLSYLHSSGTYPLPMISHSIDFPFTLMPEKAELKLVNYFEEMLLKRKDKLKSNPWLCDEQYGQAFLVWGTKL